MRCAMDWSRRKIQLVIRIQRKAAVTRRHLRVRIRGGVPPTTHKYPDWIISLMLA
jgi:hypothetical protein